jgi:hypothetical protein
MFHKKKSDPDHMNNDRMDHTAKRTGLVSEEDLDLKYKILDAIFQRVERV